MYLANLTVPSAIFLTGNSYSSFLELCEVLQLQTLRERQFYNIQSAYIIPQVGVAWELHNTAVLSTLSGSQLTVAGDARHDSPGHCATYGTYTLLDTASNLIIAQQSVKVTEVNNSYWLEVEGARRCLQTVDSCDIKVAVLATDRHSGVRKMIREEWSHIEHEYDLWHVCKGLKKQLTKKGNRELSLWLHAIVNHLWYCASSCDGNYDMLRVKWLSMLYHITNRHSWGLALGDGMTRCGHDPYSEEDEKQTPWLKESSDAYSILESAVKSKTLLADLERVGNST